MKKGILVLVGLVLAGCGGEPATDSQAVRGVTDTAIRLGTHQDLSGPVAFWGVPMVNGVRMRFNEANTGGGVHGRRIEFVVEDAQYQVPVAVKAVNKLINVDEIFAMVAAMGTPMNNAVMDRQIAANVPNLFPLSGAVSMYEPLHPLKFAYYVSYRDQARAAVEYMTAKTGANDVCLQVLANDYGEENRIGFQQAVEALGLNVVYAGSHKSTETDFIATAASIKASNCEFLVMAPLIKDTILLYTSLRAAEWDGDVITTMAPYHPDIATAGDGAMDGLHMVSSSRIPDFEAEVAAGTWVGDWYARYVESFGEEPVVQSVIGYVKADLVIQGLEAAGRELTVESLVRGLEQIGNYKDPFGGTSVSFTATKRQGGDALNVYRVTDQKWQLVEEEIPY